MLGKSTKPGEKQPGMAKIRAKSAKKRRETPSEAASRARAYYRNNAEQAKTKALTRYHSLSPAEKLIRHWRSVAKPSTPKPGSAGINNQRKVALAQAYCDWSDIDEVVRIYMASAIMTELTGIRYVVDHIVPLSHPLVCGLHTHTNMWVITADENSRKGNMVWPDMPEITWDTIDLLASTS